jgi:hypothetical protein
VRPHHSSDSQHKFCSTISFLHPLLGFSTAVLDSAPSQKLLYLFSVCPPSFPLAPHTCTRYEIVLRNIGLPSLFAESHDYSMRSNDDQKLFRPSCPSNGIERSMAHLTEHSNGHCRHRLSLNVPSIVFGRTGALWSTSNHQCSLRLATSTQSVEHEDSVT